jgi:hypothetical protein
VQKSWTKFASVRRVPDPTNLGFEFVREARRDFAMARERNNPLEGAMIFLNKYLKKDGGLIVSMISEFQAKEQPQILSQSC